MSEAKAHFGGIANATSPNKSSIDGTSKKPVDDRIKMQSSATVPSQVKQTPTETPNRPNTNLNKNETSVQSNLPKDANNGTCR
jgi:hypothetical protein